MSNIAKLLVPLSVFAFALGCSSDRGGGGGGMAAQPESFLFQAAGGTYTSNDGVTFTIPMGAVTQDESITLTKTILPTGNNITPVSAVWKFTPEGKTFPMPITISIPYTGGAGETLSFYYSSSESATTLEPQPNATLANGTASTQVTHFSFGCVAFISETSGEDGGVRTDGSVGPGPDAGTTTDASVTNPCPQCMNTGSECLACCESFGGEVCTYTECVNWNCAE